MNEREDVDNELDPRIQIELEKLNTTTDEINKLEIEYDEANTTFRMLLNESTRRLKLLSKKLGSCIERARPYYEALEVAKKAQQECQKAAVLFQQANEIHAAAKETVALAEQRFMSNQHEWQFDNAWQEMLNHATIKVMDAENEKAESGREHQRRAIIFKTAEDKVKQFEDKLQRYIIKSRPYFDEKTLCQEQLNTQKERIETIKKDVQKSKQFYSQTLKQLEEISNEIHMKRQGCLTNSNNDLLKRPREPGVGAELNTSIILPIINHQTLPDFNLELDKCEIRSCGATSSISGTISGTTSSVVSEKDENETLEDIDDDDDLDDLKLKFKELAIRPVNGGEGKSMDDVWESELKNTVDKLDHMMLMRECANELNNYKSEINNIILDNNNTVDKSNKVNTCN